MTSVTVLVPNNIAGIVVRRHLAEHGIEGRGSGIAGIFVSTLARLAEEIAAPDLYPRRPATTTITAAAWRSALAENPGVFGGVAEHPSTARALASAHRELRDLDAEGRDTIRGITTLTPDLLRLHERVTTTLGQDWYDAIDLLTAAAQSVSADPRHLDGRGVIVLYLPQALTRAEATFARALAARGLTVIAGLTGVTRADETVISSLHRLDVDLPANDVQPSQADRVLHASDSDDEVRSIVREVTRTLALGTPAHRVAILHGAPQPYARLLHEQLAAAQLVVNGPGTRAVHERALPRAFLAVLGLATTDLPRAATFTALAEAPTSDLGGDTVQVARWERVSRLAGVVGDDWRSRLATYIQHQRDVISEQKASADDWPGRIETARREIDAAERLSAFITRLRERLLVGESLTTWHDLSAWALAFFHDLYGAPDALSKLPAEEQYAAAVVESALRNLPTLDSFESTADLSSLVGVLSLELEGALPRIGRFGEGIFVGPISAAIGLDLDVTYVVGLAEDGYPGRLHEDALLNDTVRAAASGQLRRGRDQLDAKHREVIAAFASARTVVASFPRGDLRRSTERLPSRFLLHTLRSVTGNPDLAATEWDKVAHHRVRFSDRLVGNHSFADAIRSIDHPATDQEWQVRTASAGIDLKDPLVLAARTMRDARATSEFSRFDGHLGNIDGLPDFAHTERVISPTSLETYASCPHRYFVSKLLRVEPLEHPEEILKISAMEIGNLIHESMDQLIKECEQSETLPSYGKPWTTEQRDRLRAIVLAEADEFAARGLTGHPRLWAAELQQILVDLERMLDNDNEWRHEREAAVISSEVAFGLAGKDPVVIQLDDGQVRMLGSADKVDRTRDGVLLVTDIKSGGAKRFSGLKEDPVAAGTKLQLPVYAYAAKQRFGGDQVEAQYWFVRGRDAFRRIEVALDSAVEKVYAATIATLVQSIHDGLFIPRPSEQAAYGWVDCEFCTPGGFGHDEARARYERKRGAPALVELMDLVDPVHDPANGATA